MAADATRKGTSRLEGTAYHEAGHAGMRLWLGRAVKRVTIVPDAEGRVLGYSASFLPGRWLRPDVDANDRGRNWIEREVKMLLAGRWAEFKYAGRHSHVGASGDDKKVCDLLSYLCGSEEEITAYWKLLIIRTRQTLDDPPVWAGVTALASALLSAKTLNGREADRIFWEAVRA